MSQSDDSGSTNVNYFKIENCRSFTPVSRRVSKDYIADIQRIDDRRNENIENGRRINHGIPFSEEEKSLLSAMYVSGKEVEDLVGYFERSVVSIALRLKEIGFDVDPSDYSDIPKEETSISADVSSLPSRDSTAVYCEECGDPISAGRIEAMPFAIKCVDCQDEEEKASKIEQ